jgi:hypothetical protein
MEHPRRGGSAPKEKTRRKGGQPGMPEMFMGWGLLPGAACMHGRQPAALHDERKRRWPDDGWFWFVLKYSKVEGVRFRAGAAERPCLFGVRIEYTRRRWNFWVHHLTVHTWRSGVPFDRTATRGEVKYSSVTDEVRYIAGQRATRRRRRNRGSLPQAQRICSCTT